MEVKRGGLATGDPYKLRTAYVGIGPVIVLHQALHWTRGGVEIQQPYSVHQTMCTVIHSGLRVTPHAGEVINGPHKAGV